jgi:hypothetical protein
MDAERMNEIRDDLRLHKPGTWEYDPFYYAVRDLLAEVEACYVLLREIEWYEIGNDRRSCHFCLAYMQDGHKPDCKLAKLINNESNKTFEQGTN